MVLEVLPLIALYQFPITNLYCSGDFIASGLRQIFKNRTMFTTLLRKS
jgi:hypothetical protein